MNAVAQDDFESLEGAFRAEGPAAVFDRLIARAVAEKDHRLLFGTRLMQLRHRTGLPLIETEPVTDVAEEHRPAYEAAFRDAAREAGALCLSSGDIPGAWPYFRALGDTAPVAVAIESATATSENIERIIEIAYQEAANPRKGFELLLEHHGICRAITWFPSNRDEQSRQQCLQLLVRTLYQEIAGSLKATIATREGAAPHTDSVAALIAGRDWLFEDGSYYVDSTHVASVLGYTPELYDIPTLRMAVEIADYGQRLAPMHHFRADPPFEDIYLDHGIYLRAVLGEDVENGIAHFGRKADESEDPTCAEILIDLLLRLDRPDDAVAASLKYFPDANIPPRNCPSILQLCQIAGDYTRLRSVARERDDLLGFAAGIIQG